MRKRILPTLLILAIVVGVMALPAYAAEDAVRCSDAKWTNGRYTATLAEMAARKLYVYGILESQTESADDAGLTFEMESTPGRLETARMLHAVISDGEEAEPSPFIDVPAEYAETVDWLYAHGVTKGVSHNQFGDFEITRHQLLVMISRFLGWGTEDADELAETADNAGLLPTGFSGDGLTFGDLYLILSALLDECCPDSMPARGEMSVPYAVNVAAHSYDEAIAQVDEAVEYAPNGIVVSFSEECPQAERDAFYTMYHDCLGGDDEIPLIRCLDTVNGHYFAISCQGEKEYRLSIVRYSDAYKVYVDSSKWLRYFEDTALSEKIVECKDTHIVPIVTEYESERDRAAKAHALVCQLASYDYAEFSAIANGFGSIRSNAHSPVGFLENGEIVCDGYAYVYQWVLLTLGIDSFTVVGYAGSPGMCHAWNKVKIEGKWYNADVCWADTGGTSRYFLRSDDYFRHHWHSFRDEYVPRCFASAEDWKEVRHDRP